MPVVLKNVKGFSKEEHKRDEDSGDSGGARERQSERTWKDFGFHS